MNRNSQNNFRLNEHGDSIIENYNTGKPFSSFFPGIAGKSGIPMWIFFVNRGQGICSMGIQDKDNPIMEFLPANRAYQLVSGQGFRTFMKFPEGSENTFYEPFQDHYQNKLMQRTQQMLISPSHLELVEDNKTLDLKFTVEYHSVPEDQYAGLIRTLHIENTGNQDISFEGLDGLPLVIPFGLNNFALKHLRRLTEAFVEVSNYDQSAPLFKVKVEPADRPEVVRIKKGNFYIGMETGKDSVQLLKPIVDPQKIFGSHTDYAFPAAFLDTQVDQLATDQIFENRLPSAMSPFSQTLQAGQTYTLTSVIGHIDSKETLNSLVTTIMEPEYIQNKKWGSQSLINALTAKNMTVSGNPILDQYVRQNFLDNVLRGGFPFTLKGRKSQTVLHLYSRRHGDLERDYNDFRITPTNYSQGNGAYRDVNQNRRSDLLFNPDVKSNNLEHFYNLIQLDGFNPLVIKEIRFIVHDAKAVKEALKDNIGSNEINTVLSYLSASRTPGELLAHLEQSNVEILCDPDEFLGDLLAVCQKVYDTDHGEGYWSDHWTYNLDLLENYLSVYPEKLKYILFEKLSFTFHDSPYRVLPRDDKYVVWDGNPMQLEAVFHDKQKEALIGKRSTDPHSVRNQYGSGEVYYTTLMSKILSLVTNKIASLDPSGLGVEMESDKPGWDDALNGLPALMGSSLCETMEIKRNIQFLLNAIEQQDESVSSIKIFEELYSFIMTLQNILDSNLEAFLFWDKASAAKEKFREAVNLGISGIEIQMTIPELTYYLIACLAKLEQGIDQAWDNAGKIPSTYFTHAVTDYEIIQIKDTDGSKVVKTNAKGQSCFRAKGFSVHHLPHFLEGPVHYLRCRPEAHIAKKIVQNIRQSDLYDKQLGMYKVNACLDDEPMEIGRARVFSPGWFENESIWLHMEYKYMLEVLRNELYDEFFHDFKKVFIPFMDPEVYGRSILENSSFIVSSANPDPNLHGTGFVARLSGATAEFIQILMYMAMGPKPFDLNEGELIFNLDPVLPAELFTEESKMVDQLIGESEYEKAMIPENTFSFNLFSNTLITYHNPKRKHTYGSDGVSPKAWSITDKNGDLQKYNNRQLPSEIAEKIRSGHVKSIHVDLG